MGLRLALLGDMALYGRYSVANRSVWTYFRDVVPLLKRHDHVIANLETPLCDSSRRYGQKSAHIRGDEASAELLTHLNIDIVNLANNHIFDYGRDGYEATKRVLEERGIRYFGIEDRQVVLEEQGSRVALMGYCCYSTNALGYYSRRTGIGVNKLDASDVERKLIRNHESGYLSIASLHMGLEHVNYPSYDHLLMARAFAEKVPYVLYGHHPHVMQGIEQIGGSLIAYSLGNFCFDDVYTTRSREPLIVQSEANKRSFILSLDIEDNRVARYEVIPLCAGDERMRVGEDSSVLDELAKYSAFLSTEEKIYVETRDQLRRRYIDGRRSARDLGWYLRRLNVNSVGIVLRSWFNQWQYERLVRRYVSRRRW